MYGLVDSKWYLYVLLGVENFITFVSLRTVNQLWEKCNVNGTKGTPHAHWGHFNNNREREKKKENEAKMKNKANANDNNKITKYNIKWLHPMNLEHHSQPLKWLRSFASFRLLWLL